MSLVNKKKAYTYEQAAEAIGVSVRTIRRIVHNGDLVPRYPTAKPVLLAQDLDDYLENLPTEAPKA